ncbi:MAG: NAD(P)H-dependent oxidoreductase [Flavobacteriales bacterium]|nr:NAD(P)H-dependent oxidoreductase [Flavobacteriales bacterium]
MNILTIPGSSSTNSINKKLAEYAGSLFEKGDVENVDLNDYEVDIFSVDKEKNGIPKKISELAEKIDNSNLLILSLAEHNGSYSAAFKNVYDWLSRIPNRKALGNKPMLLLATSPGGRGGASVLAAGLERFPRDGSEVWESFSLPSFNDHFTDDKGITTTSIRLELIRKINFILEEKMGLVDKGFSGGCDNCVGDK